MNPEVIKVNKLTIVLAIVGAFVCVGIITLHFIKASAQHAFEVELLKDERRLVLEQLTETESALIKIKQYSDNLDQITSQNIEKIEQKTGVEHVHAAGGGLFEMGLAAKSGRWQNQNVLDRVSFLSSDALNLAHKLEGLSNIIENRKGFLSAVPSTLPTLGDITSGFGYRKSPFTKRRALHKGIDIAAEKGTPVISPADGVVRYAGWGKTYGKVLMIDHGYGIITKYAHNSKIMVSKGRKVKKGQVLAKVGNTGRSTGPHLHYEVWVNGNAVDPSRFFLGNTPSSLLASSGSGASFAAKSLPAASYDSEFHQGGIGGDFESEGGLMSSTKSDSKLNNPGIVFALDLTILAGMFILAAMGLFMYGYKVRSQPVGNTEQAARN